MSPPAGVVVPQARAASWPPAKSPPKAATATGRWRAVGSAAEAALARAAAWTPAKFPPRVATATEWLPSDLRPTRACARLAVPQAHAAAGVPTKFPRRAATATARLNRPRQLAYPVPHVAKGTLVPAPVWAPAKSRPRAVNATGWLRGALPPHLATGVLSPRVCAAAWPPAKFPPRGATAMAWLGGDLPRVHLAEWARAAAWTSAKSPLRVATATAWLQVDLRRMHLADWAPTKSPLMATTAAWLRGG